MKYLKFKDQARDEVIILQPPPINEDKKCSICNNKHGIMGQVTTMLCYVNYVPVGCKM